MTTGTEKLSRSKKSRFWDHKVGYRETMTLKCRFFDCDNFFGEQRSFICRYRIICFITQARGDAVSKRRKSELWKTLLQKTLTLLQKTLTLLQKTLLWKYSKCNGLSQFKSKKVSIWIPSTIQKYKNQNLIQIVSSNTTLIEFRF